MNTMTTNSVTDKLHQPALFNVPKWSFVQKKVVQRSFQPSWFNQWKFLEGSTTHRNLVQQLEKSVKSVILPEISR